MLRVELDGRYTPPKRSASRENKTASAEATNVADAFTPKLLREEADPALAKQVKALIRGGTPEGVAAAQRGMARRKDSLPTLPLITCPTLVVCGDEDRLTPPAESQRIASLVKGARFLHIPAAGHLSNLENPSAFNAALTSFFASLPA